MGLGQLLGRRDAAWLLAKNCRAALQIHILPLLHERKLNFCFLIWHLETLFTSTSLQWDRSSAAPCFVLPLGSVRKQANQERRGRAAEPLACGKDQYLHKENWKSAQEKL